MTGPNANAPERDPALDRAYGEAPREAPPVRLDEAIRAAARREVAAAPRRTGHVFRGWQIPVSLAAVVVLSVSVILVMREEGADAFRREAPAGPQAATDASNRQQPAPVDAMDSQRAKTSSEHSLLAESVPAPAGHGERPGRDRPDRPDAPPSPLQHRGEIKREPAASVPSLPAAPFPGRESPRSPASESAGQLWPADEAGRAKPAAVAEPERAANTPRNELQADRSQPQAQEAGEPPRQRLGTQRKPAGAVPESAKLASGEQPLWAGLAGQPPERWLELVRELRRAGRAADADAVLAELHRRFPDHALPAGNQDR